MERKPHCTAVVLAGGSGKRMQAHLPKQYMPLGDKPLIWYALNCMEKSKIIDSVILVTASGDIPYCKDNLVEQYGFRKVERIVEGGAERFLSVWAAISELPKTDYVFVHDGARPFVTERILEDTFEAVQKYGACVAAVPVKDTIKICDEDKFAVHTPNRRLIWAMQTPQVFEAKLIQRAYAALVEMYSKGGRGALLPDGTEVTDDAMVVEHFEGSKVKLVEASYRNIKITTPEDMVVASGFLSNDSEEKNIEKNG